MLFFQIQYIREGFAPLIGKDTFFLHSWIQDTHRNAAKF